MKKSLIALAVLAASGASFAQVTVTGNLTYGYQSTTTGATAAGQNALGAAIGNPALTNAAVGSSETAGLGAETARVIFTAKEDLGGGFAATAKLGLNTTPGGVAGGDDTTLLLATPVGGLVLGTMKAKEYLSGGVAGVDAYYSGWDGKVLTPRNFRDFWAFVVPVGAFTFTIGQQEKADSVTFGTGYTGASAIGGPLSKPALTNVGLNYAAGPVVVDAQYLAYKDNGIVGNNKDTARLSASYDLGMAKLGAGYQVSNALGAAGAANPKITDWLVGAKVPMGASSFGVTYASRTWDDAAVLLNGAAAQAGPPYPTAYTNGTASGYSLEYGYAMSKRTSVIANYARWTQAAAGITAGQDASTQYNLLLSHSF